jgi:hypothetical protein
MVNSNTRGFIMNLIAWNKETDTAITPERPPSDLEWARFPNGVKKQYVEPKEPEPPAPIRTISTGAMQRRFTIEEEVFIASDAAATVIKSRLLNASYCDLDFQDTVDGVNYICGILAAGAVIPDAAIRSGELLIDGTEQERYP